MRVEDSVQLTSPTSSTGTHDTWRSRSTFRMSIRSCLGPDLNLCAEVGEANCRQFAGHSQRELQSPWGRRVFGTPRTLRQAETKATNVSMYLLENKIMIPEARRNAANLSQARRTPLSSSNALDFCYLFALALLIIMPPSTPAATATPPAIASPYMPSLDTLSSIRPCRLWLCRLPGSFSSNNSLYRLASA